MSLWGQYNESMKIKSKAQAKHFYEAYKAGKITYQDLMKSVHETGDMSTLPERIIEKKPVDKKTEISVKGLV